MSLRNDPHRKVTRAARRNDALKRAVAPVVGQDARAFEQLESRVLMSLIHDYAFNEGAGTTTADAVAGANNKPGTLITDTAVGGDTGTAGLAAGPGEVGVSWQTASPSPAGGSYLHFDGAPNGALPGGSFNNTGGRVDLAPTDTLPESLHNEMGKSASVTAWIRINRTSDGEGGQEYIGNDTAWQAPAITGNEQAGAGNDNFYGWISNEGRIGMQKGDAASAQSSSTIADGSWHHVAVSRDYDTGNARVYLDGRLQSSVTTAAGPVSAFWDSIGALTLVDGVGVVIQGYNYLNDTDLDGVKLYNHVLTQGEVLAQLPASLSGPLTTAPTPVSATVSATNPRQVVLNFTDANLNEAGFIIERAVANNGVPGAFTQVAQIGAGSTVAYTDTINVPVYNQPIVYRVRAFNLSGDSANGTFAPVQLTPAAGPANAVSAGYFNSNFWGALARQWGTDPDTTDGATGGNAAAGVGSISLNGTLRDPANPAGIDVSRDPDVRVLFTGTNTIPEFNVNWGTGAPATGITVDNHTVMMTGKLNFTVDDLDGDPNVNAQYPVQFEGWTDDDGWVYVNGVLVSTDPGGHGQQAPGNIHPGLTVTEGQTYSWDVVALSAEQGGGSGIGVKWLAPGSAGQVYIPMSLMTPVPTQPQASQLVANGAPGSHQVSFNITDTTTSEQRFELWRKLSSAPDSAYVKVNEAGINAPFINDASAQPGTAYDYILLGYNFASGYTPMADAIAKKVSATTAAADPVAPGLNAQYFNDDFWGLGQARPLPVNGNLFVGAGGDNVSGADVYATAVNPQGNYGDDNHDPAVVPGGSPSPLIRDNSHSTLWTGKLIINAGEEGLYNILGFGDDDTHVIVDNVIVSSDPNGHGARDPRIAPVGGQAATNGGFTNTITLAAGEHDITILHSEQGGGSGIFLRWIRPGQTAVEDVPVDHLSTAVSAPVAPGAPTTSEISGGSVRLTAVDNATNELKNVVVLATDAAFTQNVRRIPVGILVGTGAATNPTSLRVTGLTPNTDYFAKLVAMNNEGQAESPVTTFNSGGQAVPAAPTALAGRAIAPTQIRLTWTDNSFNETGFVIRRMLPGETVFTDVDTVLANTTNYVDNLPATATAGQSVSYQVVAINGGGASAPTATLTTPVGGAGGTGLRRRLWTTTTDALTSDDLPAANNANQPVVGGGRVGEPGTTGTPAAPIAPDLDDVEGVIPNTFSGGAPDINIRDLDTIAIEWVGEIQAEETKAYNFSFITDDGGRLFINDKLVIQNGWRDQGDTEYFAEPISLTAGQHVKVRFEMYEQGGGATARLRWNGPGNAREDVPVSFMFPTVAAGDEVANVPFRAPTQTAVFGMPGSTTSGSVDHIDIRWQDNAFGEVGYQIQRATDSAFTQNVVEVSATDAIGTPQAGLKPGSSLYSDYGTFNTTTGTVDPLVPGTEYFYRIRPVGSPTWTTAGSAKPVDDTLSQTDLSVPQFTQQNATANAWANITAPGTVTLTEAVNYRTGSVWLNRAFNVGVPFTSTFDVRMSAGSGADGMAFIIQNAVPAATTIDQTQVREIGGVGGGMGFSGIQNSVGLTFDFHDNIDQMGLFLNGQTPAGGNVPATRTNDPANWPLAVGGTVDLRALPVSPEAGTRTAAMDINNSTAYRVKFLYDPHGFDVNGTPGDTSDDIGVATIEIRLASAADTSEPLVRTKFQVDLATSLGTNYAAMGFAAATGGANSKQEVLNFNYDGPVNAAVNVPISDLYVRGSAWTASFKQYLETKGMGNHDFGYRLLSNGTPVVGPAADPDQILPWINMNEVVVKYASAPTGAGIPTAGSVVFTSAKGVVYTATAVTPVAGDPTAFVITLNQPLGGGNPATGVAPTAAENGDRITVGVTGAGAGGSNFSLRLNVLQGDTDHTGETGGTHSVLAADYSAVKKKFFKDTTDVTNDDASYSAFHDVNGSGNILANDFSEVKKRFFQNLAPAAAAAGDLFGATRVAEEVLA